MTLINQLVKAAYDGNLTKVEEFLLTNMDVNCKAEYPCAHLEKIDVVTLDYPSKERFEKIHPNKWSCAVWREESLNTFTPLAAAILSKKQYMVHWLLQEGCADAEVMVKIYSYGRDGYFWPDRITDLNMLSLAIIVGDTKILQLICQHLKQNNMLQKQAVNMTKLEHRTEITQVNAFDIMEQLNDTADLRVFLSYFEWSPVIISEILQSLVQRLNDRDCKLVRTCVQEIIRLTSQDIISESILQSNIIHIALRCNKIEFSKYSMSLLSFEQQKQALVQIQGFNGYTLLNNAVILKNVAMIEWLCNEKNDVNLCDAKGNTALHNALILSDCPIEIMCTLIKHGAEIDIKNNAGKTALDLCRQPIIRKRLTTERSRFENKDLEYDTAYQTTNIFVTTDIPMATAEAEPMASSVPTVPSGCCFPLLSFSRNKEKYSEIAGAGNTFSEGGEYKTKDLNLS
jgi:ankyrin repeat protein